MIDTPARFGGHPMGIRTVLHLSLGEWVFLLIALPIVAAVRTALWALPSRFILRAVRRLERRPISEIAHRTTRALTIVWAVEAASRRVPQATCLTQALSAKLLLRALGQHAQLCLGVARNPDGSFRAHAWLEHAGRPILGGTGIQSMVRLPEFPDGSHIAASLTR
jgi:hypothetical protein